MNETVFEAIKLWTLDHGWRIVIILIVASIMRRFGVLFISRVVSHSIETSERFENQRDKTLRSDTLVGLINSVMKIATYLIVGLLVLSELNILELVAPLLAGAGVLSLLIGFGIQTFVKDFISGMFIVAENQYRVGDVVAITAAVGGGSVEGTVLRITLRTTVIRDYDGAIHFIPNGNIARAANQTLDYAKVNIEVAVPAEADLDAVEHAINTLGVTMQKESAWQPSLIEAPVYHGVQAIEKEQLVIEVRAKTTPTQQWRVSSEVRKRVNALLQKNDHFVSKKRSRAKK